jgi:hypothetical protein
LLLFEVILFLLELFAVANAGGFGFVAFPLFDAGGNLASCSGMPYSVRIRASAPSW